jgi:hypothetical protein
VDASKRELGWTAIRAQKGGELNITTVLESLKKQRELFHSEADFQFALAWEIQKKYPTATIRLESPINKEPKEYIDILIRHNGFSYPIELKYKTTKLSLIEKEEEYSLKNHSARDNGCYDCIKDICRMESFADAIANYKYGYVLWLTNDSGYWKPVKSTVGHAEFSIEEGITLTGTMKWGSHLSAGTIAGREEPLSLKAKYTTHWNTYGPSRQDVKNGEFRYVLLKVKP